MVSKIIENSRPLFNRIKTISFAPLYRNAYALIGSNLLTAFSGYVFWIIAARRFSDESIGITSAIFSAMMLIGLISDLGFGVGLIRFLPTMQSIWEGNFFINRTFTMRLLFVTIVTAIFLAGIPWWTPGLTSLNQQSTLWLTFLFFVILNGIFTLSSSVFVALRRAIFVFLSALIFNAIKLILVVVSPSLSEIFILLFSVTLALLVTIIVELFIFMPKVREGYKPKINFHFSRSSDFLTYSASNQAANILIQLPVLVLPLLVINFLGPQANARFYVAFMTAGLLRTAGLSISQSAFAESSNDSVNLFKNIRSSLWLSFLIIALGGLIIYFLAPWILFSFGKEYSEQGTYILRWLIISVIPFILINLYFIIYRVRKNLKVLLLSCAVWAVISIGFSIIGIRSNELQGLAIGWTIGQFAALIINGLIFVWYRTFDDHETSHMFPDDRYV
jgi:O-antigen/teichoic acid export membrane protein